MISPYIKEMITSPASSAIRKMFEQGKILKAKYGNDKVFDFSLGNPDLDPPKVVLDAIEEVAKDRSHGAHGYMSNSGYDEAKSAMAKKESLEQGVNVGADCVVMACGAAGAINSVFKTLLSDGDEVIVPSPFFVEYRNYAKNFNAHLLEVPTTEDFSLDVEKIKAALTQKTQAVLINSPNNPTGRIYSENDIKALCSALKDFGAKTGHYPYLICDEPYRAITYDGKKVASVFDKYEYAVVVTSFAKNLSIPGERIGYTCVNPACPEKSDFIAGLTFSTRVLGYVNAPGFFQKVVAKSWNAECDYSAYERRRDLLKDILDNAGIKYADPEGAFYIFAKVPDSFGDDDAGFVKVLEENLILCPAGSGFGMKGWFRICYCVEEKTIVNSRDAFYKAAHTDK
ncbi:pyridoxal phosphate-dependent aminotransferase [Treponema sp.]|uniref:pyridoxal phosphate-dependent aminotransferase n=1 Tax=Treponema sp. TaxID=166 RepID=UPI00298DBAA3|nr:pyridoxal phosphate-dependent aminotransferase [Treponema sp.]MCR5613213.1 pyridoxal phosphate-dependent aminotransferase [Treponema sp.]